MNSLKKIFPVAMVALLFVIVLLVILIQKPKQNNESTADNYVTSDGSTYYMLTDEDGVLLYSPVKDFPSEEIICYTKSDINVIPDKYNTGASPSKITQQITKENYDTICKSILFSFDSDYLVINFHNNKSLRGDYKISGVDFTGTPVRIYSEEMASENVCITFENCMFTSFTTGENGDHNVTFIFKNCSFKACSGCNMTFYNCYFGGSAIDGINPYQNVSVYNSYFADRSIKHSEANAGTHTDGVQIYGSKKYGTSKGKGGNIHFSNCRFELPQLKETSSTINACIMLQIEFNDTDNVSFEDCIVNGGGYSIYAYSKNEEFSLSNALLKNISVGCNRKFGKIYPNKGNDVSFIDVNDTDSLYVSSVRVQNDGLHLSVTNDTNDVRTLLIHTSAGDKLYSIPECPLYDEVTADMCFEDFPFDIDINIGQADWFICYDISDGKEIQLRFYNTSGTYVTKTKP